MPFFEYRCQCGNEFEVLRNINAHREFEVCPNCGRDCKQLVSEPSQIQMKGGTGAGRHAGKYDR